MPCASPNVRLRSPRFDAAIWQMTDSSAPPKLAPATRGLTTRAQPGTARCRASKRVTSAGTVKALPPNDGLSTIDPRNRPAPTHVSRTAWPFRWRYGVRLRLGHRRTGETVTVLRHGFNPLGPVVAENLTKHRDLEREVGLLNESVRPERPHQFVLRK